jgi:hypothetical protein
MLLQRNNDKSLIEMRPLFPQEDHPFLPQEDDPRLKGTVSDIFGVYQKQPHRDTPSLPQFAPSSDFAYLETQGSTNDSFGVVVGQIKKGSALSNQTLGRFGHPGISVSGRGAYLAAQTSEIKGNVLSLAKEGLHTASTAHLPQPTGVTYTCLNERIERSPSVGTKERKRVALDWVEEHRVELEGFAGEWLLIVNEELIAHSATYNDILRIVKERRPPGAIVHYVPQAEERSFIL